MEIVIVLLLVLGFISMRIVRKRHNPEVEYLALILLGPALTVILLVNLGFIATLISIVIVALGILNHQLLKNKLLKVLLGIPIPLLFMLQLKIVDGGVEILGLVTALSMLWGVFIEKPEE